MVDISSISQKIADVSTFEVYKDPEEVIGYETNGDMLELRFDVEFDFGYNRDNGDVPDRYTFEPDVVHISHIWAEEGRNLGSAALAQAVDYFREQGFSVARMSIINPRVIGMVEKLIKLNLINEHYYILEPGIYPIEMVPTQSVPFANNLVTPQEATDFFIDMEKVRVEYRAQGINPNDVDDPNANGGVNCTLFF